MEKIWLSSPTMHGEEMEFIKEAFDSNWVAPLGANVDGFERDVEAFMGGNIYAAALSAGTAAIHLAFRIIGIKPGDIVFGPSLTFAATVNPITYEGGIPVFIDSERESWNMDPAALEEAFKKYPDAKALIVANLYGTPAKLKEIEDICDRHKVPLIEDAAESLGATYRGTPTGSFGEFGILSFNGNKIITTSGGGMLLSKDEKLVQKARFLSTQAREKARHYEHKEIGFNYRMSNIVAGIGRGQMKHLSEHVAKKKAIREEYSKAFSDIAEIKLNPFLPDSEPNYWLTCITIDSSSPVKPLDILEALEKENIESRPIWKPMHMQPVFKENAFVQVEEGTSVSQNIYDRGLCLPSDIKNSPEDMDRIVTTIRKLFGR